jgi:hypothetical protein
MNKAYYYFITNNYLKKILYAMDNICLDRHKNDTKKMVSRCLF